PPARELELDRALNQRIILLGNVSSNRKSIHWRRVDQADVAKARKSHVKRAGNRRRRQGEDVRVGFQCLELLFMLDTEAMLFVDDNEPEIFEGDIAREKPMRTDD